VGDFGLTILELVIESKITNPKSKMMPFV